MNLQTELDGLSKSVAKFHEPPAASEKEWEKFVDNTVVALMACGESSRYAAVLNGKKVQKNAHELPNGDTMIEMAIRMYRDSGLKKFVALVFHHAHTIEDRLGNGSGLGVEIKYCQDPDPPAGKGGAIRNAIEQGFIPHGCSLIVVNPDDVVLNFPGSFVRYIGNAHIEGDNKVVDTMMYPVIPVPLHVCASIFSPKVIPRFLKLFSLTEKSDFENVLFPILARQKKLWSVGITEGTIIPVNDLKAYKQLVDLLE